MNGNRPRREEEIDSGAVVIVGTGRCGSTLLHRLLARHERLAWLSQLCEHHPSHPGLNALGMRLLDTPGIGGVVDRYLDPVEAYALWEAMAPGFAEPDHDLERADLEPGERTRIRSILGGMLTRKRRRLLLKITGWPRIGYLDAIFEGAHYVHILRDGRAVAASYLKVPWWRGREGPEHWRWGSLDPELERRWAHHDRSPASLAGIQWELLVNATEAAAASLPARRYTRVRYEDLCSDPIGQMRHITAEAGLEWSKSFEEEVKSVSVQNRNSGWRDRLDAEEKRQLESVLAPALTRYGYV